MDLVITQELAHAESQQGGRGPRPSALPRAGPVPPGSEFPTLAGPATPEPSPPQRWDPRDPGELQQVPDP